MTPQKPGLKTLFELIHEFHEKFELNYDGEPRQLPHDMSEFRIGFLEEELTEYKDAVAAGNLEDQLDALADLVVVTLGTAYLQGFDFDEAFRRVMEANMKKVRAKRASDSKRGSVYDVVKPHGWEPAFLKDLI